MPDPRHELVRVMAEAIQSVWPGPLAREGVASAGAVEDAKRALQAALDSGHLLLVPPGEVGLSLTREEAAHGAQYMAGVGNWAHELRSLRSKLHTALTPDEQER